VADGGNRAISRGFANGGWPNWLLPVLYVSCRHLRNFAILADEEDKKDGKKAEKLEDAARYLNKMFTLCLSDRAPLEESRKRGTYYIVNLLFKTYFKVWDTSRTPRMTDVRKLTETAQRNNIV